MKIIGIVLLVVSFLVALALGTQNQEVVNFNYLLAQGEFKLSLLLGIVFGTGFALGWLICGLLYLKAKMSASMLRKQVNKQRQELDKLRTDPVKE
ncbi:lipopolysaccharide assembly protein LapA domain-containing protein [Enterovibrio sp. ZSDZ35]|uniref:Probable lipopolysaccharide assembly protein A n=1 Tax=Enterovibrio qingdaonensis TaxID=2899818 RepID=A0ABT5QNC6_9GAMM|nr:lipopolysaccharide assembly protein LapA domain-containing protein [Enterovibrio sp. ZSDZ35]MDD1781771.1 lipopolysaccharide assembly protein LapA domain-containing protein [Enterovibrio sp. ZSDZ35]